MQQECDEIGGCPVGGAVITSGGNLNTGYVIHAVGPRKGEGDEKKLKNATLNSLKVADEKRPEKHRAPGHQHRRFRFSDRTLRGNHAFHYDRLPQGETVLERECFCLYGQEAFGAFVRVLKKAS